MTQVSSDFSDNMKKWVTYDNQIQGLQQQIKELRDTKKHHEEKITRYIRDNNLDNSTFNVMNSHIKLSQTTTSTTLSFRFLQESLIDYFQEQNPVTAQTTAQNICQFIKQRRERTTSFGLRRNSA